MNKMEVVQWAQDRYDTIGFNNDNIQFVPISGLQGENLTTKCEHPNLLKWYDGGCLVDILDKLRVPNRPNTKPLRLTVMDYTQK
jgi:translation elongation factor EF-1alpha